MEDRLLAKVLDTTVGYLLGENPDSQLIKDPAMLKRFNQINDLPERLNSRKFLNK